MTKLGFCIAIYHSTILVGLVEAPTARVAWRMAITEVKADTRDLPCAGTGGWQRTANRECYSCGPVRAVSFRAHATTGRPLSEIA